MDLWCGAMVEVVAMHGDIEVAARHGLTPNGCERCAEAFGERHTAALNANKHDVRADFIALADFVGDAGESALDGGGVEDDGRFRHGGKLQIPSTKLQRNSKHQTRPKSSESAGEVQEKCERARGAGSQWAGCYSFC